MKTGMKPFCAPIVERQRLAPDIYSVWLRAPGIARRARPGQFVQVRINDSFEPFLRRPISIAQRRKDCIRLVFRVVGRGTALLAGMGTRCGIVSPKKGDAWDIIGPLGRPAPLPRGRSVLLVGGGMGIAPLLFLAEEIAGANELMCLLGAKTKRELILWGDFARVNSALGFATENGSFRMGVKGLVTDLLDRQLSELRNPKSKIQNPKSWAIVFACGPRAMLQRVQELCTHVEAYAFWEERMGCGTGICYGCAVRSTTGDKYIRFCQEGPVLNLKEIELSDPSESSDRSDPSYPVR